MEERTIEITESHELILDFLVKTFELRKSDVVEIGLDALLHLHESKSQMLSVAVEAKRESLNLVQIAKVAFEVAQAEARLKEKGL